MTKLAVHLVTYNGAKYVPYLFESLRKQTYHNWELLIIDNGSTDGMVEAMQKELVAFPIPSRVIVNKENKGFAGGHNQAFKQTSAPFFAIINQDMMLEPNCLEALVSTIEHNQTVGAVAPAMYRWDFNKGSDDKTSSVDTYGLKVFRNRRVVDMVEMPASDTIFGVSGALALFRRSAINMVVFADGTFFDEQYFMYKEDVDLAFRLAAAGFVSKLVPSAKAYHDRTAAGAKDVTDTAALKNKQTQSEYVKRYSYRNHLITLYKNEYWQNFVLDMPWIGWYELKKFFYFLFTQPSILKGIGEMWTMKTEMKNKKLTIKKARKISWREMRKWWHS